MDFPPLSRLSLLSYAQLAFPLAFAGLPLYIHGPDFYSIQTGLSLGVMGAILLGVRAADAVIDPWIGRFSDRYARRRARLMGAAVIIFALSLLLFFNPQYAAALSVPAAVWFAVTVFAATVFFSYLTINLNAVGSLLSEDMGEKTRIAETREFLGLIGLIVAVVLPGVVISFGSYAVVAAMLSLASAAVFLRWLKSGPVSATSVTVTHAAGNTFVPMPSAVRTFLGAYFLSMLASSMPAVLVIFFIRDRLGAADKTGLFLMIYFLAGLLAISLWRRVAARLTPERSWMVAMAVSAVAMTGAACAGSGDHLLYAGVCLLTGIAFGGELVLPPVILSRLIDDAGRQSETGLFYGYYAFCLKIALALASAVTLGALDMVSFKPGSGANSTEALATLGFFYAILPCLLKVFAVMMFYKTGGLHEKVSYSPVHGGGRGA